jgi:hypothetical protein
MRQQQHPPLKRSQPAERRAPTRMKETVGRALNKVSLEVEDERNRL